MIFFLVKSFIEVTKYLLRNGCKFVLPRKMCQDPLEEHFGRHRTLAARSNNPSLYQFGWLSIIKFLYYLYITIYNYRYQENKLRLQRSLALQLRVRGNTKGAKRVREVVNITTSPMKKRRRNENKNDEIWFLYFN